MKKHTMKFTRTAAALAGLVFACSAGAMTAGTFSATVQGRNGPVTVEVATTADRITKVEVTSHKETPGIGELAVEGMPKAILESQRVEVDAVTGATMSSVAIKKAVREALEKAGATEAMLTEKARPRQLRPGELQTEADVIVVGGGGAGLVAAATASGLGKRVIVLEKMAMLGGNTARSEGATSAMDPEPEKLLEMTPAIRAIISKYVDAPACSEAAAKLQEVVKKQLADHDAAGKKYLFDSPELFALQTIMGGDCKNDPKLVLTMAKNATAAMEWLDANSPMTWFHVSREWLDGGIGGLYPRAQRIRAADGKSPISTYDAYIKPLAEKIRAEGNAIYTQMKVTQLTRGAHGRVTGVRAVDRDGTEHAFTGKSVVLAAGGYGANLAMVKKYNDISVIATSNQPGTTGEVIEEAVKEGAALEGMAWIQIHPHGNPKNGELESAIAGQTPDTPYVNREGKRFADETGRRDEISHGILAQPGQVVYSIYDQQTIEQGKVRDELMQIALSHGYAYKADSLEALAQTAGIEKTAFMETMAAYNEAARTQNTKALSVPKIIIGQPVEKAPFYAVPLTTTIHHTMGGLKINEKTEVLNGKGEPIPGLYAAGEVTGGIHGSNRLGRNALTDLLVFGCIAGREVARE